MHHLASAAQRLAAAFGQTKVLDLTLILQLLHRFHGLFDGRYSVQAVGVVEVDVRDSETLKRALTCFETVLWRAVNGTLAVHDLVCELRSKEDILPLARVGLEPVAYCTVSSLTLSTLCS